LHLNRHVESFDMVKRLHVEWLHTRDPHLNTPLEWDLLMRLAGVLPCMPEGDPLSVYLGRCMRRVMACEAAAALWAVRAASMSTQLAWDQRERSLWGMHC
jgi:hypothetical protein